MEMIVIGVSAILLGGSMYMLSRKIENIENKVAKIKHTQTNV